MKKPTLLSILQAALILGLLVGAYFIVDTQEQALSGAGGEAPTAAGH